MDVDLPTQALRDRWEDVEADLDATADELAGAGWQTVTLHAGDTTTRSGGDGRPAGLDVLVPGNEFDALETLVDDGVTFSESMVFRQSAGGVMFLGCVFRDPDRQVAVLVPAFYPQRGAAASTLADRAREAGELQVHVHPLVRDRVVTFSIGEPELVFPTE